MAGMDSHQPLLAGRGLQAGQGCILPPLPEAGSFARSLKGGFPGPPPISHRRAHRGGPPPYRRFPRPSLPPEKGTENRGSYQERRGRGCQNRYRREPLTLQSRETALVSHSRHSITRTRRERCRGHGEHDSLTAPAGCAAALSGVLAAWRGCWPRPGEPATFPRGFHTRRAWAPAGSQPEEGWIRLDQPTSRSTPERS